jgi:hypothetical protein
MLFAFEYCCCMLGWLWIFYSLLQEIVPSQLIWGLYKLKDEIIILLTHALWLSIFLLHAWVMMDWVWSFMYRIELNRWNCFWLLMISTLISLVLFSAAQRVNIYSRSCSDLLQGNKLNTFLCFRLWMISTLTSCSCICFSGQKGQHLKSLLLRPAPR